MTKPVLAKKPHFYLIPSSLGMKDARRDKQHLNAYVAEGPLYLTEKLNLNHLGQVTLCPIKNWDLDQEPRYKIIADQYQDCINLIKNTLQPDEIPVTIGGDHSTSLPAIIATLQQLPSDQNPTDFGLLMLDSHTDLHQPATSPSLNFHGMWLRPIIDQFAHLAIDDFAQPKISPQNLMFVGDHSFDFEPAEAELIAEKKINNLSRAEYLANPQQFITEINNFNHKFKHLHVTFDLDFITSQEVAVNICNDAGFKTSEFDFLLKNMTFPEDFSLSFSEFNPQRPHLENSLQVFSDFLARFFPNLK